MRRAPGTGSIYRPTWKDAQGVTQRGRLYWIAYRLPGGKLKREPAKTAARTEAEALLRSRLATLDRGELPPAFSTTWDDLAEIIKADYRANGRRSGSRLDQSLAHLAETFAKRRAASITADQITAYAAARLDAGAARATVNREFAALKRAFRLAHRSGRVPAVPYVAMLKEKNARTGFFERAQFLALLRHLPDDLHPAALTAYVTGWRVPSEILTRQWRHVDLRAGWLRLEPGETKSGAGRQFPLTPELKTALRAQQKKTQRLEKRLRRIIPWVFHTDGERLVYGDGTPEHPWLASAYWRESWEAACTKAGIPGRIPHDFRRTAIRNLLRAGVSQRVAMMAVGWESEAMLRRYAIVTSDDLKEAGAKLSRKRL